MKHSSIGFALFALTTVSGVCSCAPKRVAHAPDSSESGAMLFERGVESARAEDFSRAEQYLAAALARGYPESRAVPWLVSVCLASERLRTALHYAEPYLARHPDEPQLLQLIAAIRLSLGDAEGARADLEHATRVAPDYAPTHYLLAVTLRDSFDERPAAVRELVEYLRALPDGPHAAEARSFLRDHATERPRAPKAAFGGNGGSRSSSPTDLEAVARAGRVVPR